MFKLKKLHEPFGTPESPQYETSYSEGLIPVVNGICDVRLPESRDRLLKLGYEEILEKEKPVLAEAGAGPGKSPGVSRSGSPKNKKQKRW